LETYYKGMKENFRSANTEREELIGNSYEAFQKGMKEEKEEYTRPEYYELDYARGLKLLQGYFEKYSVENFEVVDVEFPLEYTFPSGDKFTGTIDLKVKQNGKYYIVDHKTTGWSMSSLGRSLGVSDQATGYIFMNNIAYPKTPVAGVIFNILRNVKSVYEYGRLLVVKPPRDLEVFKYDAADILQEISEKISNLDTRWIKNTYACFSFGRPCPYLDLCQGANYEGLIGIKYKQEVSNEIRKDW